MRHFAISVIGRDRPGIVAAVTRTLLDHGANIEDSQSTILRGHFTMTLIVSAPDEVDEALLRADLERTAGALRLEAATLSEVSDAESGAVEPSHIVTVYGVDHPGIVHAVAALLAEREVNITDLTTRLVEGGVAQPLYAMMLEVALPAGLTDADLSPALAELGVRQGVEVVLRPLEQDTL